MEGTDSDKKISFRPVDPDSKEWKDFLKTNPNKNPSEYVQKISSNETSFVKSPDAFLELESLKTDRSSVDVVMDAYFNYIYKELSKKTLDQETIEKAYKKIPLGTRVLSFFFTIVVFLMAGRHLGWVGKGARAIVISKVVAMFTNPDMYTRITSRLKTPDRWKSLAPGAGERIVEPDQEEISAFFRAMEMAASGILYSVIVEKFMEKFVKLLDADDDFLTTQKKIAFYIKTLSPVKGFRKMIERITRSVMKMASKARERLLTKNKSTTPSQESIFGSKCSKNMKKRSNLKHSTRVGIFGTGTCNWDCPSHYTKEERRIFNSTFHF